MHISQESRREVTGANCAGHSVVVQLDNVNTQCLRRQASLTFTPVHFVNSLAQTKPPVDV